LFGFGKDDKEVAKEPKALTDKQIKDTPQVKASSEEMELASKIQAAFEESRAVRMGEHDETGYSIEEIWEDEDMMRKGGGLQWCTNFAYRPKKYRQIRPNSEDNFIHNSLLIMGANITANTPDVTCNGINEHTQDVAKKITSASRFNDERNNFATLWDRWVNDFIGTGQLLLW
jgi:hypothetical protein